MEVCGAFGEEGGGAFGFVFGRAELAEEFSFDAKAFVQVDVRAAMDGLHRSRYSERSSRSDLGGESMTEREEFGCGMNFIDETDAYRVFGGDHIPGEKQAKSACLANQAWETLGSTKAWEDAELDLGLAELRGVCGKAKGAGEGQLTATAEGEAVNEGDDGLAAVFNEGKDGLAAERHLLPGGGVSASELVDVRSGGKGLFAGSGDKKDADSGVAVHVSEDVFKLIEDLGVESVQNFGTVEGDSRNMMAYGVEQGLVGHTFLVFLRG